MRRAVWLAAIGALARAPTRRAYDHQARAGARTRASDAEARKRVADSIKVSTSRN